MHSMDWSLVACIEDLVGGSGMFVLSVVMSGKWVCNS